MKASSSLLAALPPALPAGEAAPSVLDHSAAPLAAAKSFFSVMAQLGRDGFPKPFEEATNPDSVASQIKTPPPAAAPTDNAVKVDNSAASTLLAVMVQSQATAARLGNPAATLAASFKSAPVAQDGGTQPVTKTSSTGASAAETPKLAATAQNKVHPSVTVQPQTAAAQLGKPAAIPPGNSKTAAAGPSTKTSGSDTSPTGGPAAELPDNNVVLSAPVPPRFAAGNLGKPASSKATLPTKTLSSNSSAKETPTAAAAPPDNNLVLSALVPPQLTAGELSKPVSVQTVKSKIAPTGPEVQVLPPTKTPGSEPSAASQPQVAIGESPKATFAPDVNSQIAAADQKVQAQPLAKTLGTDASLAGTSDAVAAQAQVAVGELSKPPATQPPDSKIEPDREEVEIEVLTQPSGNSAPLAKTPKPPSNSPAPAVEVDDSVSNTLSATTAQPQVAAENLSKPASTQPADSKIAPENGAAPAAAVSPPESRPRSAGPVPKTIAPIPAETPASTKVLAGNPAEPTGTSPQPVTAQITTTPPAGQVPADGTGGALSSQRMSFSEEKNETAGLAAQKVPGATPKDDFAPTTANAAAGALDADPSVRKQDAMDSMPAMNGPARAGDLNLDAGKGAGSAQSVNHAATVAERVGHLVNQQVVMMRQSGASHFEVSLKIDPRTELSLQLTKHNGQIEASVRWERGSVTGLDNHWKDLQDSLARQNVQLLPLESKTPSRAPAFNSASNSESAPSFKQTPQNPQGQSRQARRDLPLDAGLQTVPATNKTTSRTAPRQGWESWA